MAMATIAVSWLKMPFLGYFVDLGKVTTESTVHGALVASAKMNEISGIELKKRRADGVRSWNF